MRKEKTVANGLKDEKSPYLRKHAFDPIDWQPWGESLFRRARAEDRLIFLSVGYRSCHWCNVMHDESFSDPEVGRLVNEAVLAVKVDREERPDIDGHYMAACRHLTGGGGWPLSVVLTPEGKPVYAATYLPPRSRSGRVGLTELLSALADGWCERRQTLLSLAEDLHEAIAREGEPRPAPVPVKRIDEARQSLLAAFDGQEGGFFGAPKFPLPHLLLFLMNGADEKGQVRETVERTLEAMVRGALRDQLGGGYHRYATDRAWTVPHFEKMLYDQAGLAQAFLEAGRLWNRPDFLDETLGIIDYVLTDLASPEGVFFSSEDADSGGREGGFYLWTEEELADALGGDAEVFKASFGLVAQEGPGFALTRRDGFGGPAGAVRERLLAIRRKRPRPFRDEKVLADWNGHFLSALARAGALSASHLRVAGRGMAFLLDRMGLSSGILAHSWIDGELQPRGFLDDQAFVLQALVDLHEAGLAGPWCGEALALLDRTEQLFGHPSGAYRFAPEEATGLLPPRVEGADEAYSSGNGVMALVLARLGRLLDRRDLADRSLAVIEAFGDSVADQPWRHATLLTARTLLEEGWRP
ncbi:MAG: thioredoxin domain-containing protein [Synergistaceae bacterium]|nr:thioredoxin domain-containing protein [Synergistaceae bacterium]